MLDSEQFWRFGCLPQKFTEGKLKVNQVKFDFMMAKISQFVL